MVRVAVPAYTTRDHKHRLERAQTKRQALDREEAGVHEHDWQRLWKVVCSR